jgi:hypothetical protein
LTRPSDRPYDPYVDKPEHGLPYQRKYGPQPARLPRRKRHRLQNVVLAIGGLGVLITVIAAVANSPRW